MVELEHRISRQLLVESFHKQENIALLFGETFVNNDVYRDKKMGYGVDMYFESGDLAVVMATSSGIVVAVGCGSLS